jgi:hypothetical protein
MKKIINILLALLLTAVWYGCKEDPRGIVATDSDAPGPVTNPVVESLPGGAKITYQLPNDRDLLYVQAIYTINGVEKNASATLFVDTLVVQGFGTTDPQTINLYAIDRSGNRSVPTPVEIRPGMPPIQLIRESMEMVAGFGGVQVSWINEYKADVVVTILADSLGFINEVDAVYSNLEEDKYSVRGLDTTERIFGVYVRDRWDNYSDTVFKALTPLYELKLDKKKWVRGTFIGDNTDDAYWWGPWERICDDIAGENQAWETYTGNRQCCLLSIWA